MGLFEILAVICFITMGICCFRIMFILKKENIQLKELRKEYIRYLQLQAERYKNSKGK